MARVGRPARLGAERASVGGLALTGAHPQRLASVRLFGSALGAGVGAGGFGSGFAASMGVVAGLGLASVAGAEGSGLPSRARGKRKRRIFMPGSVRASLGREPQLLQPAQRFFLGGGGFGLGDFLGLGLGRCLGLGGEGCRGGSGRLARRYG